MANIKDVAKRAGVSVSTVSNILNGKVSVAEDIHQRVIIAMQELEYHPNFLAMNLRKKKMGFIGIIVSSLAGHYNQIVEGIYRVATEKKCQPILKIVSSAIEEQTEVESLIQFNVSGIIVLSSHLNQELVEHYKNSKLPIVFADLYPKDSDFNAVRFDNYDIVNKLTLQLNAQGKTVGLITGNTFFGSEKDCLKGYTDAIESIGQKEKYNFESELVKERAFTGLMDYLYNLKNMPDCFIVSTSHLAKTTQEILGLLGKKNVSVIGLSGDSWVNKQDSNIFYQPRGAIFCGMQAMSLLLENIQKPVFDTKIVTIDTRNTHFAVKKESQKTYSLTNNNKIKLLLLKSNVSNAVEKLSRDFTASTGIEVEVTAVSQSDLIQKVLLSAKEQSSEFDVIMADMHHLQQLKQEKVFLKLNDLIDVEEILPRYVRDVRNYILSEAEDKELYALPILSGYQILAYRNDLFSDPLLKKKFYLHTGLPLEIPQTWGEFNLISKFFTKEINPDSPVKYGTCLTAKATQGIMAEYLPRQWSYNGQFIKNGRLDLMSNANAKAIKNLCESYKYSYPNCTDYLEDEQIQEFLKGDIAMISTYNVHLQDKLEASNPNIQFAKIPGSLALVGGWLLGINRFSNNIEQSAKFLEWEMSVRISVHSSLLGQISPFKSVFFDDELSTIYPWMKIIKDGYTELRGKEFDTTDFNGAIGHRLEEVFSARLQKAIKGEMDAETVLGLTQQEFGTNFYK